MIKKSIYLLSAFMSIFCISINAAEWQTSPVANQNTVHTYVPESVSEIGDGKALMVLLPGCSQSSEIYKEANLELVAEQYGMVIALTEPNSPIGAGCWNYSSVPQSRDNSEFGNVIGMVQELIETPENNIDPNQVYITGYETGGAFAMTLGCMAPDIFAGMGLDAAPSAGTSVISGGMSHEGTVTLTVNACRSLAGNLIGYFNSQITSVAYGTEDSVVPTSYAAQNSEAMAIIYDVSTTGQTNEIQGFENVIEYLWSYSQISLVEFGGVGSAWPAGSGASGVRIDNSSANYALYLAEYFKNNNRRVNFDDLCRNIIIDEITYDADGMVLNVTGTATNRCGSAILSAHIAGPDIGAEKILIGDTFSFRFEDVSCPSVVEMTLTNMSGEEYFESKGYSGSCYGQKPELILDEITVSERSVLISGSAFDNDGTLMSVSINFDGDIRELSVDAENKFSVTYDNLSDGNYEVVVTAEDDLGNTRVITRNVKVGDAEPIWRTEKVADLSTVHIYVPRISSPVGEGRSMLILMGGCAQSARTYKTANLDLVADQYGMVIVVPEPAYPSGASCWNYWSGEKTRDSMDYKNVINMTNELLARDELNIDPKQIYVAGFEAGGSFAMTLACLAPDIYAGMGLLSAPSAGTSMSGALSHEGTVASTMQKCRDFAGTHAESFQTQLTSVAFGTEDSLVPTSYANQNSEAMALMYGVAATGEQHQVQGFDSVIESVWENNRVSIVEFGGVNSAWPGGIGASGSRINNTSANYGLYLADYFSSNNLRVTQPVACEAVSKTLNEHYSDGRVWSECTGTIFGNYCWAGEWRIYTTGANEYVGSNGNDQATLHSFENSTDWRSGECPITENVSPVVDNIGEVSVLIVSSTEDATVYSINISGNASDINNDLAKVMMTFDHYTSDCIGTSEFTCSIEVEIENSQLPKTFAGVSVFAEDDTGRRSDIQISPEITLEQIPDCIQHRMDLNQHLAEGRVWSECTGTIFGSYCWGGEWNVYTVGVDEFVSHNGNDIYTLHEFGGSGDWHVGACPE